MYNPLFIQIRTMDRHTTWYTSITINIRFLVVHTKLVDVRVLWDPALRWSDISVSWALITPPTSTRGTHVEFTQHHWESWRAQKVWSGSPCLLLKPWKKVLRHPACSAKFFVIQVDVYSRERLSMGVKYARLGYGLSFYICVAQAMVVRNNGGWTDWESPWYWYLLQKLELSRAK